MLVKSGINSQNNLSKIMRELKEKYKNVYIFQFEEQVFIYHTIGRRAYKELVRNENFDPQTKEEELCAMCVVYPENYDFANCEEAGLPTRLADEIIQNSYLTLEQRDAVTRYYKNEMNDMDNQVNCIIQAAFPTMSLDTIEDMDVVTAAKYLSRAEWILHNISGVQFREVSDEEKNFGSMAPSKEQLKKKHYTEEILDEEVSSNNNNNNNNNDNENNKPKAKEQAQKPPAKDILDQVRRQEEQVQEEKKIRTKQDYFSHRGKKKEPMSPEKLAEMKRKYPEIDWDADSVNMYGISAITEQVDISDVPAALQPRSKIKRKPTNY